MISEVTPSPQMPGETDECKSLFVELVLFCPRSFFSLSCYFYCYFGILLLFIFSSYLIFTVDTSSHRSTSTGTSSLIGHNILDPHQCLLLSYILKHPFFTIHSHQYFPDFMNILPLPLLLGLLYTHPPPSVLSLGHVCMYPSPSELSLGHP